MRMTNQQQRNCRRATAVVELAAVITVFLLILFGIIEYARFIFVRQMMINASQEGARYAVVHTLDSTVETDTKGRVLQKMAGVDKNVKNFSVELYQADNYGNDIGSAADAEFGELIAVEVEADYVPFLPSFLFMNNTIRLRYKSLMASEAN